MRGEDKADSQSEEPLKVKRNPVLVAGSSSAQTDGGCTLQWHSLDSRCLAQILINFSAPCLSSRLSALPVPHPSAHKQAEPKIAWKGERKKA